MTIPIESVPKPRMTRSDKWNKRPVVIKYRDFCDVLNLNNFTLPEHYHIYFLKQMPKSWSKKKKAENNRKKHTQTPDKDNLEKAVLDALFKNDSQVWDGRVTKIWSYNPAIIVYEIDPPDLELPEIIRYTKER
jgi:Holliday junction resolvase RusA-like endonuclease